MNHSNYGYPSSSSLSSPPYSDQFSSTPANSRPQRPRFGFSNVPSYPRPRSSATKPNPDAFSDGLRNDYGDSDLDIRRSYYNPDEPTSSMRTYYGNSVNSVDVMRSSYENSDVIMDEDLRNSYGNSGGVADNVMIGDSMRSNYGNSGSMMDMTKYSYGKSDSMMDSMRNNYGSPDIHRSDFPVGNTPYSNAPFSSESSNYYSCNDSFYDSTKYSPMLGIPQTSSFLQNITTSHFPSNKFQAQTPNFGVNSGKEYGSSFKKSKFFNKDSTTQNKPFNGKKAFTKKKRSTQADFSLFQSQGKNPNQLLKKGMATKSEWQCSVCGIEFTSNIPLEMHLRGAKHAKKLKTQDVLQSIQLRAAQTQGIKTTPNALQCEICNVKANSSLQFQTHLDGVKHKNKLQLLAKEQGEPTDMEVNGKTSTVRPLPAEFGEQQPAKLTKYSCDTCNIAVNSETQLQQHLVSKKHQAKVEGKPIIKQKLKKGTLPQGTEEPIKTETENPEMAVTLKTATGAPNKVVGIKTLSSSFIPEKQ